MLTRVILITLMLAGCAPLAQQNPQTRTFDAVPGRSVIYIVRTPMDSREASGLALDDREQITTARDTFYRWEVAPGTHRIAGTGPANESITLSTSAGGVYFLEHTVRGDQRHGVQSTAIRQISEQAGRALVMRSQQL